MSTRPSNYLPNSGNFSLVSIDKADPARREPDLRAHWPIRLTQLVGGKRWSISFVWHKTPHPILTPLGVTFCREAGILPKEEA